MLYDVTATRQIGPDGAVLQTIEALTRETGDLVLVRTTDGWALKEFT